MIRTKPTSPLNSIPGRIFVGFLIILTSVIVSISISHKNSNEIIESEAWVIHTHEVIAELENIEARLLDLETGQRGYLITGKSSYLEPFNKSMAIIYSELKFLREKTSDNPIQTRRIDILKKTITDKIEELNQTIELRKNIGFDAAKEIVDNDSGKKYMEAIRNQLLELKNEELRLLEIRTPKPEKIRRSTNLLLIALLIFTMVIVIIVFLVISRSIIKPINALQKGAEIVGKGNLEYKFGIQSKDEIGQLSHSFEAMLGELKKTLSSKKVLEAEIEMRIQTEKKLIESKEALLHKNKELEEAKRLSIVGEFAAGIAHEVNNPLAVIHSKSQLLELQLNQLGLDKKDDLKKIGDSLESIQRMSIHTSKLIKNLKTFSSKADFENMEYVQLSEVLNTVLNISEKRYLNSGITMKVSVDPNVKVMCSSSGLAQVVLNLISNSMDAIECQQDKWITIESKISNEILKIIITDSGGGIPDEIVEKITQPFFSTKDPGKGTGLGLAISLKSVEKMKGKFYYNSKSENTQFVIEFSSFKR